MKLVIKKTKEEASSYVAKMFVDLIQQKPNAVLGLATGSTPLDVYSILAQKYSKGEISFKDVKAFNLDEYIGIEPTHEQSYKYFMNENLFKHIDIAEENCKIPSEYVGKPEKHGEFTVYKEYDELIYLNGGIDLQILGLGLDGHIGFNEPGEISDYTHVATLDQSTLEANSRFFDSIDDVPKTAVSMGIKTIYNAKKIVMLVLGENKADIVKRMLDSKPTGMIPATLIMDHIDLTIVLDEAAASKIA